MLWPTHEIWTFLSTKLKYTKIHKHTRKNTHTQTKIHAHKQKYTHTQTKIHTHKQKYTHSSKNTHTHKQKTEKTRDKKGQLRK